MKRWLSTAAMAPVMWACLGPAAARAATEKPKENKAEGYLEWRAGEVLVVDGQRVRATAATRFKGKEAARDLASIPLGYEVEARGPRDADGALRALVLEAKPNGKALFESEVRELTDEAESKYRRAGRYFLEAAGGRAQTVGEMLDSGPAVERARRIVDALLPPYLAPEQVRVYVIENKEWNAFAMGNYSIYVFSGLLADLDDDELAIVLGHELAHATHEHTRRQFKKQMWIQLAALGVASAAETIDGRNKQAVAQLLVAFGATTWSNGFGRDLEDQADRVGLRYAYEAGYDMTKGPRLWNRFAQKYGQGNKVANFFFSDHSLSAARAINLEKQIALNYADGPKEGGVRYAARPPAPPAPRLAGSTRYVSPKQGAALVAPPAAAPAGGGATSREIKRGMTTEQVRALLGAPTREVAFAQKRSWAYPDLTVVFENGRVVEVKF